MKFNGQWLNKRLEQEYRQVCREITQTGLSNFKRHPKYIGFVGNDVRDKPTAIAFYNHLIRHPYLGMDIEKLLNILSDNNDKIGAPLRYIISFSLFSSPGTLRFAKVFNDFIRFRLPVENIIEIGSGYGGQALCIKLLAKINYTLLDIHESLELAKKYLSNFELDFNFKNADEEFELEEKYSLCISDYCISELDETGCDFYLQNVVDISDSCYLTINEKSPRKQQITDFCKQKYSNFEVLPETPKTSWHNNLILIGK